MMSVRVLFYNPFRAQDPVMFPNKMIASCDPYSTGNDSFCHTELQFRTGEAVSMYMGSGVVIHPQREFDLNKYTAVDLPCTLEQAIIARQHVDKLYESGSHFSMWAWLPLTSSMMSSNKTYCSKLVADILHTANIHHFQSTSVSPSHLYHLLTQQTTNTSFAQHSDSKTVVLDFKTIP